METITMQNDTVSKVNEILTGLAAGKTRDQIALEIGYKNFKSLDIYMKRKKFDWDNKRKYYYPKKDRTPLAEALKLMNRPEGRAAAVLSLLKSGMDMKEIAVQLKFNNHRELALFMKNKGYIWNGNEELYIFCGKDVDKGQTEVNENLSEESNKYSIKNVDLTKGAALMEKNESNLQVIDFLESNKEILYDLIASHTNNAKIPRYVIAGVYTTKSVHMNYGLDQLMREYSTEKNVSQKDICEVAIVDFLKKYGFQNELSILIER